MTRYPILLSPSRRPWRRTETPFCPRRRRPWGVPWYWWGTSSWTPRYRHRQRNRETVGGMLSRGFCGISCAKMFDSHTYSKPPLVINRHSVLSMLSIGFLIGYYLGFSIKIACFEVKELGLKNNACVVSENLTDLPFALDKWNPFTYQLGRQQSWHGPWSRAVLIPGSIAEWLMNILVHGMRPQYINQSWVGFFGFVLFNASNKLITDGI